MYIMANQRAGNEVVTRTQLEAGRVHRGEDPNKNFVLNFNDNEVFLGGLGENEYAEKSILYQRKRRYR